MFTICLETVKEGNEAGAPFKLIERICHPIPVEIFDPLAFHPIRQGRFEPWYRKIDTLKDMPARAVDDLVVLATMYAYADRLSPGFQQPLREQLNAAITRVPLPASTKIHLGRDQDTPTPGAVEMG